MSDQSTPKSRKLLDQIRDAIRLKHYSYNTEKTYVHWAKRYILFHNKRHPAEMDTTEIKAFLTHLATAEMYLRPPTTRRLTHCCFYIGMYYKWTSIRCVRVKRSEHLPTVMAKDEVARLLSGMQGLHQYMAKLLYGCGLRLTPALAS